MTTETDLKHASTDNFVKKHNKDLQIFQENVDLYLEERPGYIRYIVLESNSSKISYEDLSDTLKHDVRLALRRENVYDIQKEPNNELYKDFEYCYSYLIMAYSAELGSYSIDICICR